MGFTDVKGKQALLLTESLLNPDIPAIDLGGIVSLVPMRGDHRFLFDLLDDLRDLLYDLWTWSMSEVSENAWLWLWL